MTEDANKRSFKSEDQTWESIERQEDLLNQLEDAFAKIKEEPKPHEGIPNSPTPFRETEKLAMEGNPISQFNLSTAYADGEGVTLDLAKAEYWLLESAKNGFAPAQYNLGCYWLNANERQKAFEWFMMAAKQNFGPAQFNLGLMYGNASDYATAFVWFSVAAQNKVAQAKENREIAAAHLDSDGLNAARLSLSALMLNLKRNQWQTGRQDSGLLAP